MKTPPPNGSAADTFRALVAPGELVDALEDLPVDQVGPLCRERDQALDCCVPLVLLSLERFRALDREVPDDASRGCIDVEACDARQRIRELRIVRDGDALVPRRHGQSVPLRCNTFVTASEQDRPRGGG